MSKSRFAFDKFAKLIEQGLVNYKDISDEIVNILKSKRDEIVFRMKLASKEEVDVLIDAAVEKAVAEAVRIDEASMAKHNRDATVISMILGFTTLALFVDGLLRMLGIIPPFMEIDINILDKIETDIIDRVKQVPIQKILQSGFR